MVVHQEVVIALVGRREPEKAEAEMMQMKDRRHPP